MERILNNFVIFRLILNKSITFVIIMSSSIEMDLRERNLRQKDFFDPWRKSQAPKIEK